MGQIIFLTQSLARYICSICTTNIFHYRSFYSVWTSVCVCLFMAVFLFVFVCICVFLFLCVYFCVCVCVYISVSSCVCWTVFLSVCVCVCVHLWNVFLKGVGVCFVCVYVLLLEYHSLWPWYWRNQGVICIKKIRILDNSDMVLSKTLDIGKHLTWQTPDIIKI